ncbi:MAG: hypothetical protein MR006_01440 [Arcanobacterium sp.]|nr:hypothetical protein [Arcanobacterium sp.]
MKIHTIADHAPIKALAPKALAPTQKRALLAQKPYLRKTRHAYAKTRNHATHMQFTGIARTANITHGEQRAANTMRSTQPKPHTAHTADTMRSTHHTAGTTQTKRRPKPFNLHSLTAIFSTINSPLCRIRYHLQNYTSIFASKYRK